MNAKNRAYLLKNQTLLDQTLQKKLVPSAGFSVRFGSLNGI